MVCEVQKRFLLENIDFLDGFLKENVSLERISVFYSQIDFFHEIKYKKNNKQYFCIKYNKFQDLTDKQSYKTNKKHFKKSSKKPLGDIIIKNKYSFFVENLQYFVYEFKASLKGLYILKIIFPTLEDALKFSLPSFVGNAKDISENKNFYTKYLALYGNELKTYDINQCFKILEKHPELELSYPLAMKSIVAFRILLFSMFRQFRFYQYEFLKYKNQENLDKIYKILYEINLFFDIFDNIFEKHIQDEICKYFKNLAQEIQNKNLAQELFLEHCVLILSSKKLLDNFSDFELVLREESDFFQGILAINLKMHISKVLRKELIFFKRDIYKHGNFEQDFDRISFLLKYFSNIFKEKSLIKLTLKAKNKEKFLKCCLMKPKKYIRKINKITKILKIYSLEK